MDPGRSLKAAGLVAALLFAPACGPSYPKEDFMASVRKLFKKELKTEVRTQMVGRTLYVSFDTRDVVSSDLKLPKTVVDQLEGAMLSISRLALSTDVGVQYSVIEARDPVWGVRIYLVRRMQDLKDLIYWRISKPDFDERLIFEIERADLAEGVEGSTASAVPAVPDLLGGKWHDIGIQEFMAMLVASRINLGMKMNPFLGVFLGIEKVSGRYDAGSGELSISVGNYESARSTSTASVMFALLKKTVSEQVDLVEKKYVRESEYPGSKDGQGGEPVWARAVVVRDAEGKELIRISRGRNDTISNRKLN